MFESQVDFDVVLLDGERWRCHLLEWSSNELLVETERGKFLIPRHAIKYVILEEAGEELLEEIAAEVPALQEFLDREENEPEQREGAGSI